MLTIESNAIRPADEQIQEPGNDIRPLEKLAYLAVFIALVAIRIPEIFGRGRFWAEEGTVFFVHAFSLPWYQALFASYAGYLNLPANLAGILSKVLAPLDKACFVSSGFALILQTFPAMLLCLTKESWLQNRKALFCALLLVASLPLSQEVWLSAISSQYHLNLCVGIILALRTERGLRAILQHLILFLAPLSGPGGSFLIPLFAGRAIIERSKERMLQTLTLAIATAIQLLFFYRPHEREFGIDLTTMCCIFCEKHIIQPLFGQVGGAWMTFGWRDSCAHGDYSLAVLATTIVSFIFLATLAIRKKDKAAIYFVLAGILMASLSYMGALGSHLNLLFPLNGNRYVFAPQLMFELAILSLAFTASGFSRLCCRFLIMWMLIVGLHEFFRTPSEFCVGPSWRSEVRHWQHDHSHTPQSWPCGWSVPLPASAAPKDQPNK